MRSSRLLVLGLAAAGVTGFAGCGSSGGDPTTPAKKPAAAAPVKATPAKAAANDPAITLTEWAIKPTAATAQAGKVTFSVRNAGKTTHEFVVLRTSRSAGSLGHGSRIKETGHVGELGDLAPGTTKKLTLDLKPGHYSLVCNMPGHYMSGMHADLTVR